MDNFEKNSEKDAGRRIMKHRRIITVYGFALSLALCAFALSGCVLLDLLFSEEDPPPQLIVKNESFYDITSLEFWESTPEISEKGGAMIKAYAFMMLSVSDTVQFLQYTAVFLLAYAEYEKALSELMKTSPLLKDTTVIPYDSSRSCDIDLDKSYAARVNGDKLAFVQPDSTKVTVYVFGGEYLTKKE
jgi:hypothetical protein